MTDELRESLARVLAGCVDGFEAIEAVERLSGGASQETYRIRVRADTKQQRYALRRSIGAPTMGFSPSPGMRTEAALMRAASAAGVPEPRVLHVLDPADGLGEGFVMEWVEGETLGARIVRAAEFEAVRPRLARQCGEILARVHAIDVDAAGLSDSLERMSPRRCVERTWEHYKSFASPQPMIDFTARWLLDHLPASPREALVHSDFRNGNLIVGKDGVRAVLDWELAYLGDPLRDLGWICTNSWRFGAAELPVGGFGSREDLFDGYESVSGHRVDPEHVHFWEVFGSFWWAVGCLAMVVAYRSGSDASVERPAIGRRSSECQIDCVNLLIPGPVTLVEPGTELSGDMPSAHELAKSVSDFLREQAGALKGRRGFLARVAANSTDTVMRELALGAACRETEASRLRALLSCEGDLGALRGRLSAELQDGTMQLDAPGLCEHLRTTAANQVAIDQPNYSGLKATLSKG